MNRKYESGSSKRKKQKQVEKSIQDCFKISSFFEKSSASVSEKQSEEVYVSEVTEKKGEREGEFNEESQKSVSGTGVDHDCDITFEKPEEGSPKMTDLSPALELIQSQEENSEPHNIIFMEDISNWPTVIPETFISQILTKKPISGKISGEKKCYHDRDRTYYRGLKESAFFRVKLNGSREKREWLIYSSESKSVYCYICKIFTKLKISLTEGFNDWRNIKNRLKDHENSLDHIKAMCTYARRMTSVGRIDEELVICINQETEYWKQVLKRIAATVKLLAGQGLAFRGTNENLQSSQKGNYLSCLAYLSEFDSFLAEHLKRCGNKGSGHVSYLSHSIVDEFILLMAKTIEISFINEVKSAIYYSLILDSTPDISHIDQLTFILRYVLPNGKIVERFMGFIKITSHTAEHLENVILEKLKGFGIDIKNCRGQTYDNASNMSGKYTGLQARILQRSPSAIFVPCTNHSLNLVANFAAESCSQALYYFLFVQELYTFFSASPQRWKLLSDHTHRKRLTVKRLFTTRWSARADAVLAIKNNMTEVKNVLLTLSEDDHQKVLVKIEARALAEKIDRFETCLITVIWDKLLQRINTTSKSLQAPSLDMNLGITLLKSLRIYIQNVRNHDFEKLVEEAKQLTSCHNFRDEINRPKKRKSFIDESTSNEVALTGLESFKINVFYIICDNLLIDLDRRLVSYNQIYDNFKCFFTCNHEDALQCINNLKQYYEKDIDVDLLQNELFQFLDLCKELHKNSVIEKYELLSNLQSTFPNIQTILQIYLTIPVSNASGERSFSCLKRVKNYLRSTISQERLTSLAILSIESESLRILNYDELISDFAKGKVRKKQF